MYLGSKLTFTYMDPIGEIRRKQFQTGADMLKAEWIESNAIAGILFSVL